MSRPRVFRLLRVASFRYAGAYVVMFVTSSFVLGLAIFFEARSALEQQMAARVEAEMAFLTDTYRRDGGAGLAEAVRTRGKGMNALDYLLQDSSGKQLAGEIPAVDGLRSGWHVLPVVEVGRPERVRTLVSDLDGGMLLGVGVDLSQIEDLEEAVASAFGWTIGLAGLLGIGGGVMLSRAFLRRVDAIGRTAEAIIAGDLTQRIPLHETGDDLDRLDSTLNQMLDRMAALVESLRQVGSDVAHDLRTPLSRLYQQLETAREHARSIAEYEAAVTAALHEARTLLETFSALLRIAQVEGHTSKIGFATLDVGAVAETVVDAYRLDAEDAGHRLTLELDGELKIVGDKELLTQALANLVENALRHTPPGTRIGVEVAQVSEMVRLVVEDDGPGVDSADLPHLTGRFYRAERSRTTPGNGLGLSLVNAVADLHDAELILTGEGGFRACLSFRPA